MRIYNGTNSQVNLPYVGKERISIDAKSVSGNLGITNDLISLIVTSYGADELAIIVAGPYELSMASNNPVAVNYVVQSLDEAIQRFAVKEEPKVVVEEPNVEEEHKEEVPVEEEKKEEEPQEEAPKKTRTIRIKKSDIKPEE
jgi:hypothetical protein